ncbi:hypothetical protein DFH06DRAFT_1209435 [Mycena polygramma]|nr:hypothetical protein DFH06DRAFT_1209435 [Mycena polygramma]
MRIENIRLRLRLSEIESQLQEIASSSHPRFRNARLGQELQRRLRKEKISIQDTLDSVIYPILTLPVELTCEIFLYCFPDYEAGPSARLAPMLLARVCRQWRHIAYNDSRLWAALHVHFYGLDHEDNDEGSLANLDALARDWLLRAGRRPLSLSVDLPYPRGPDSLFVPRGHRVPLPSCPFTDYWRHLTSFHGSAFVPVECFALLARPTDLIHCKFDYMDRGSPGPFAVTPVLLPYLTHLTFTEAHFDDSDFLQLLDALTSPRLHSLAINGFFPNFRHAPFLNFLQRAPAIKIFAVVSFPSEDDWHTEEDVDFNDALEAMPALTSLSLSLTGSDAIFNMLCRLCEPFGTFLPRLDKLALSAVCDVWWEDFDSTAILVNALTSRWEAKYGNTRLLDFGFDFNLSPDCDTPKLDDELLICVSLLEEKGMRVHVGPRVA